MTWTLPMLLLALWPLAEPTAFDDELALLAQGHGPVLQLLVADAAVKAQLFAWVASVQQALGDEKAAAKARAAADEALELALTDRETARHFMMDARALLERGRTRASPSGPAPPPPTSPAAGSADPERGGSPDSLERLRSELRESRQPR